VALAILGAPSAGRGQSLEDQARVLFREGNDRYAKGDYQGALDRFRKAKALHPSYKIDLNIGTALNALGRHTEAAEHYDLFLRRADRVAPRDLVKEVATSLDELRGKLGSFEVTCSLPGAKVEVDGRQVGMTPLTRPLYVEPGSHQIAVRKIGYDPHVVTLALAPGERKRLVVPWQHEKAPVAVVAESVDRPVDDVSQRSRVWLWSGVGVGALAVGAGVLGVAFNVKANGQAKVSDYEKDRNVGIAGYVIAGTAAAASITCILVHVLGGKKRARAGAAVMPIRGGTVVSGVGVF
jgi:hypothetical protein